MPYSMFLEAVMFSNRLNSLLLTRAHSINNPLEAKTIWTSLGPRVAHSSLNSFSKTPQPKQTRTCSAKWTWPLQLSKRKTMHSAHSINQASLLNLHFQLHNSPVLNKFSPPLNKTLGFLNRRPKTMFGLKEVGCLIWITWNKERKIWLRVNREKTKTSFSQAKKT